MKPSLDRESLQREIAAIAARLMVEDGHDYGQAKRKAAAELGGDRARLQGMLPDNGQVDTALRQYLRTVVGAPHRALLHRMRSLAVEWMKTLERFHPYLVGAVLNGSATKFSPLELNLYTESAKDVEIALLERGVDFRVAPAPGGAARAQEVIGFFAEPAKGEPGRSPSPILLTVYDPHAQRIAPGASARPADPLLHPIERSGRASLAMTRQLLAEADGSDSPPALRA
ncbi:conserved hypothetical protein [Burkholderiales bacterium]|nr:conserved hypothetical protein [Burkholderiales bacterium]